MEPNRRAWFQIHLSTAIVLMFVAGMILALNFHTFPPRFFVNTGEGSKYENERGWPYVSYVEKLDWKENWERFQIWRRRELAYNVLVALGILVTSAVIVEYLIRRRGARAP